MWLVRFVIRSARPFARGIVRFIDIPSLTNISDSEFVYVRASLFSHWRGRSMTLRTSNAPFGSEIQNVIAATGCRVPDRQRALATRRIRRRLTALKPSFAPLRPLHLLVAGVAADVRRRKFPEHDRPFPPRCDGYCWPLCTEIVRPTMSGRIIERRDQVLIGRLSLLATAASTFLARCRSTNGPFLNDLGT
jgi:hypothetical protein